MLSDVAVGRQSSASPATAMLVYPHSWSEVGALLLLQDSAPSRPGPKLKAVINSRDTQQLKTSPLVRMGKL